MDGLLNYFGSANGLAGLLSPEDLEANRRMAMLTAGLNMAAASSGTQPGIRPGLVGALAQGLQAGQQAFQSGIQNQVGNVLTAAKIAELKRASTNRAGQLAALKAATNENGVIDYNKLVTGSLPFSSDPLSTALEGAKLRKETAEASRIESAMAGNLPNPFEAAAMDESLQPSTRKLALYYKNRFSTMKPEQVDAAYRELQETNNRLIAEKDKLEERRLTRAGQEQARQESLALRTQLAEQAKANKPAIALPAGVQKAEDEDFDRYETARSLANETSAFINSLASGSIPVTLGSTMSAKALGFFGSNAPEITAMNEFERFKTRLVNESLRLNKGTQTDNDAKRAVDELNSARSEADAIKAMQTLQRLNSEAANRAMASVERRRVNIGLPKPEMMGGAINIAPIQLPKDLTAAKAAFNRLPVGSQYIDSNGNVAIKGQ